MEKETIVKSYREPLNAEIKQEHQFNILISKKGEKVTFRGEKA